MLLGGPVLMGAEAAPDTAGIALPPAPEFPVITRLDNRDTVFQQYAQDVETARRRQKQGVGAAVQAEGLAIYAYALRGEDLLSLAARTVPYAALITLNRLPHAEDLSGLRTVLLPSVPGLFIPETPGTDLEMLIRSSREDAEGVMLTVRRDSGAGERFLFIPGAELTPTERTFFLDNRFRFPLRNYRITSTFGPRTNPVTGNRRVHQGLDLAAPIGTAVFAVRNGVVTETGADPIYGNYVIIQHEGGWASLYGHLSEINTALRNEVKSGSLIGKVGSTGQSTGPHLHFELRQHGKAQDPGKYLFKEGSRQ
ncbi:peptidase M23 [Spirochaetia bacterium]|nr:peptidase M23 [Spirochaetia bacterium]